MGVKGGRFAKYWVSFPRPSLFVALFADNVADSASPCSESPADSMSVMYLAHQIHGAVFVRRLFRTASEDLTKNSLCRADAASAGTSLVVTKSGILVDNAP